MLQKHFANTKRITKILKTKTGARSSFCENCLCQNPSTDDDGYTCCCNERRVFGDEALANAKRYDIQRFLDTKFSVFSHGWLNNVEFVLEKKKKSWKMNLETMGIPGIIETVKRETKGLKKEF